MAMEIFLKGNSHLVFLIHGLTGTPKELEYLARSLHKKGYSVYVPYFWEFGCRNHYRDFEWNYHKKWVHVVKKRLKEISADFEVVSVGGLCLGGTLALALTSGPDPVRGMKEKFKKVFALSPLVRFDGWAVPWYSKFLFLAPFLNFFYAFSFYEKFPYGIKNERLRTAVLKQREKNTLSQAGNDEMPTWGFYEAMQLIKWMEKGITPFSGETLFIHSIEDDSCSLGAAQSFYDKVQGPKSFMTLHNSYHLISIDNEKKKVAEDVLAFLEN